MLDCRSLIDFMVIFIVVSRIKLIDKARDYFGLSDLEKPTEAGGVLHVCIGDVFSPSETVPGGYAGEISIEICNVKIRIFLAFLFFRRKTSSILRLVKAIVLCVCFPVHYVAYSPWSERDEEMRSTNQPYQLVLLICVSDKLSGIIIDLFSEGKVLEQLQEPATWLKLKERLMPDGRFMVNCGGIGEASETSQPESVDDTWLQNSTIKALSESFPGEVCWKRMPKRNGENFLALTGPIPDLSLWSDNVPGPLSENVKQWKPCKPFP
ncbi:hypothetical protein Patl1_11921 [Pistacia atlantica]|uniref:Uncharacterized protein n=1 Tax=Pistacia atlantica TaxID=434234 RepID=A0ACC1A5L0_9ROSI|nr:hypothetical protein Patl1_11921 [Pistacia atlantica]